MNESNYSLSSNQCYKCDRLLGILNIEFNSHNSMVVMWNKYQILIYENLNFTSPAYIFTPEFQVHRLVITNNYLLCLDINGFLHVTTLKFKKTDQKFQPREFKCFYQPKEQDIKCCIAFSPDESLSLKYDCETYFLCLNQIGTDFKEVKKIALNTKDHWPLQDSSRNKCFLVHRKIDKSHSTLFQKTFGIQSMNSQYHITVLSFDGYTLYGCLFNPKMIEDKIDLVKLYSCPSEICSIEIVGTECTYITLKMGTVLRLTLNDLKTSSNVNILPEVAFLNSALHKVMMVNDSLFYTDGMTMWKAEDIFTKAAFKKFFVKSVNDFIICEDKVICTTFTKLIYTFKLEPEKLSPPVIKNYYPAEELLDNAEFLHKIFDEVEKGKALSKKVSIEGSYIAAMALTKRQEIMHKAISSSVKVYESFEEVLKENSQELTLIEDVSQYVEKDIYLILISANIISDAPGVLLDIVSDILANSESELQVTLSDQHKTLLTTSIKMSKANFLIPLHFVTEIFINIRLMVRIPGTYDKNEKIWTELYQNNITLTSEHFIRASLKSLILPKRLKEDFEEAILTCSNQSRNEFNFQNISKQLTNSIMYVRLPPNFVSFDKYFSNYKPMAEMLSTEFLKSQIEVNFIVGKDTVTISLENDGFSNPRLKVMSLNPQVTASMRNFFADIMYGESTCDPGQEFINIGFYTTVENLQNAVKKCIAESASSEELARLIEKFEKEVVGMLPL